jgi:hypothetical protein
MGRYAPENGAAMRQETSRASIEAMKAGELKQKKGIELRLRREESSQNLLHFPRGSVKSLLTIIMCTLIYSLN